METSKDHHRASDSDDVVFVLSICLVMIEVLGLVCNGIILTVYYKYSRLRTATNLFILNLAICNLLLATLQLILSSPSYFNKRWLYGYGGCITYGFTHQYLTTVAVATLAIIAFDRFCVITRPVRKLQTFIVTKRKARVLILMTHVYSFVFTFPLLVGWNNLTPDTSYYTGCYLDYSNRSPSPMAYTMISAIFTCLIPLVITSCCYAKIYKSVSKSSRKSPLHQSKRMSLYSENGPKKRSLYHTRTARMISIVMFFFLLTWLPTRVTGLIVTFGCPVPSLAIYVSILLAKACVMYNAVVYVFLNHRFRAAFLHLTFVCREDSRIRFTTSATSGRFVDNLTSVADNCERSRVLSRNNLSQLSFMPQIPEISTTSTKISTTDRSQQKAIPRESMLNDLSENLCDVETDGSYLNNGFDEMENFETKDFSQQEKISSTTGPTIPRQDQKSSVLQNPRKLSQGFNNPVLYKNDEDTNKNDGKGDRYLELNIQSLNNMN